MRRRWRNAPDERTALLAAADPEVRSAVEDRLANRHAAPASPFDETSPLPSGAVASRAALEPGGQIGPYRITGLLGAGGMGEVYRAHDGKLGRDVAIKTLPADVRGDPDLLKRFRQEARMLAALNHPNIAAIHGLEESDAYVFLVLELVEGETLAARLARGGALAVLDALTIAVQVAEALEAAHARGIVHRDIKPANIKLTPGGTVKVLDFGLAKASWTKAADEGLMLSTRTGTQAGMLLGTPPYMSPEAVRGKPADHRSDIWAVGCVLYELLTGARPFRGGTVAETLAAILEREPDWTALPAGTPADVRRLVRRCFEKDPERRYASAEELRRDLAASRALLIAPGFRGVIRRKKVAIPAAVALVSLVALAAWQVQQSRQRSWAERVALPEIERLLGEANFDAAFRLGQQAARVIPGDRRLLDFERHYAARAAIASTPPGADVLVKGYLSQDEWLPLGRTPIEVASVPTGYLRWRISKDGFVPADRASFSIQSLQFALAPASGTPSGMVPIPAGAYDFHALPRVTLDEYWLDTFEVTNQDFKRFVDQGGYSKPEYWTTPIVKDGAVIPWNEAVAAFRDSTGRPGPSTWTLGTYPDGQADFPVTGVSWYEAAAYAAFAGRRLPTVYHWLRAHATPQASEILHVSNFSGKGPARVGSHTGLSPFGNYDMAGNAREWCWNASGWEPGSRRFILGASWAEAAYRFPGPSLLDPLDRSPSNGFRTALYEGSPKDALQQPIDVFGRFTTPTPVNDEVFETYRRFYSYEKTELAAKVEAVDDTPLYWREEKVTFNAAYGGERVMAYLLIPRNAAPPYQTVIYFASGVARMSRSRDQMDSELAFVDFLPRIGRAVLFLVYKGTYERHIGRPATAPFWTRDLIIAWSRDFSRAIDYLQTRDDVDGRRLGYFSFSNPVMPVLSAIDGRIAAGAHIGAGLNGELPAEFNPVNFAPRMKEPTLLVAGRYDFISPVERSQEPLLRLLGTPDEHKRLALFDTGHVVHPGPAMIKEVLNWFDRYLGPVTLVASSQ
jgi:hypothetical protein